MPDEPPPPPPQIAPGQRYLAKGGKYYLVEVDAAGKYTVIREATIYDAAPSIVQLYVQSHEWWEVVPKGDGTGVVRERSTEDKFVASVLTPLLKQLIADDAAGGALIGDAGPAFLGNDPAVIALVATYHPEYVPLIWPVDVVADATKNREPASEPVRQPANVIEHSSSQGTGRTPPASQPTSAPVVPRFGGPTSAPSSQPTSVPSLGDRLIGEFTPVKMDSHGQGTASSPKKDAKTGGDPLILFSGQLFHQATDLGVAGLGLHFAFTRTYMSQTVYRGPLSHSWDHSYNLWLREGRERRPDGTFENVVYRSTGALREDRYVQVVDEPIGELPPLADSPDAVFHGPPGFFDRLERVGSRYVLETPSGVRVEYGDNLYVERIVDLNGNAMTFEYDGSLLTVVRDPLGREFRLSYDEMNRSSRRRDRRSGGPLLLRRKLRSRGGRLPGRRRLRGRH